MAYNFGIDPFMHKTYIYPDFISVVFWLKMWRLLEFSRLEPTFDVVICILGIRAYLVFWSTVASFTVYTGHLVYQPLCAWFIISLYIFFKYLSCSMIWLQWLVNGPWKKLVLETRIKKLSFSHVTKEKCRCFSKLY